MICPNCNGEFIYNKRTKNWVCHSCGYIVSAEKMENDYVFWFCDKCGTFMNVQKGFTEENGVWICEKCHTLNDVTLDNLRGQCRYCGKLLNDPDKTICPECMDELLIKMKNGVDKAGEVINNINELLKDREAVNNHNYSDGMYDEEYYDDEYDDDDDDDDDEYRYY